MARRNMEKIIVETKVPDRYDLGYDEVQQLHDRGAYKSICDAFTYGFALGMRYQKKEDKR